MIEIDTEEDISMNKTQLKNFAVAARVALIERVKDRARGFGIDEKTCAVSYTHLDVYKRQIMKRYSVNGAC